MEINMRIKKYYKIIPVCGICKHFYEYHAGMTMCSCEKSKYYHKDICVEKLKCEQFEPDNDLVFDYRPPRKYYCHHCNTEIFKGHSVIPYDIETKSIKCPHCKKKINFYY